MNPSAPPRTIAIMRLVLCMCCLSTYGQVPLPIPATLSGAVIDLSLQEGTAMFHAGEMVDTYGYNGDLLGPTLILQSGQTVTLNVTNSLPDLTTTHWHGMHVSAANDGGPHSLIYPNTTWSPSFTVLDRAGTFWYHPHGHGLTDYQVSLGAAGMIIVRDAAEAALDLPRTYGVDDVPLILQTKAIVNGQIMLHTGLDSVVVVNGVREPLAQVPAQVVRLRCLNGASERTFNLGFSNGMPFHVIGTDGGLLSSPVEVTRAMLIPGERIEILVDLNGLQSQSFQLMAYNSELPNGVIGAAEVGNGMAFLDGYLENALNGADHLMMSFSVVAPTADPVTSIPGYLVSLVPFEEADADLTRTFSLEPQSMGPMELIEGPFEINGELMDMDVINEVVPLGSTEIWEFVNNTMVGHPIHIHDIQFNIIERSGGIIQPWETGWKDVVYVPAMGSARVITRFDDFADPDMPYMYHCHLLMHEDEGMMGQFVVVDPNSVAETADEPALLAWPTIADDLVTVRWQGLSGAYTLNLIDATGRTMEHMGVGAGTERTLLHTSCLAPGSYLLIAFSSNGRRMTAPIIIQH